MRHQRKFKLKVRLQGLVEKCYEYDIFVNENVLRIVCRFVVLFLSDSDFF